MQQFVAYTWIEYIFRCSTQMTIFIITVAAVVVLYARINKHFYSYIGAINGENRNAL